MNQSAEIELTKAVVEGVTKAFIESIVKPIIGSALQGLRNIQDTSLDLFTNRLSGYVETQYKRHSTINTIVFGNKKKLEDLYLPLTVVQEGVSNKKNVELFIDAFNDSFLPVYKTVLITDTAGMGKSTLSKFLFLECVSKKKAIPVFVELRQLSKDVPILKFIEKHFNYGTDPDADGYISKRRIERIIKTGGFCFFFDGYDEIPSKEREFVTVNLRDFSEKYSNNFFVITSRPENSLASFPRFSRFSIKPLNKDESYSLIVKYDQDGERSSQLIKKLEEGMFVAVEEFLKNPLLTTLLYRCFEYKQQIPLKKHIFYRQVFDALYDWHDSTKDGYNTREKKSNLDQDSFHKMLRVIGFISVMNGSVEGDADTVLAWIRQAKNSCQGYTFSESDFLSDVVKAVPVFVKDGLYYRWSHKSLSEYFAAQYICNDGKFSQDKILTTILNSDETVRFANVLDQIYDIDNNAFQKNITLPTVAAFMSYLNDGVAAFGSSQEVPIKEVELRLAASFGSEMAFVNNFTMLEKAFPVRKFRGSPILGGIFKGSISIWGMNSIGSNANILANKQQMNYCVLQTNSYGAVVNILSAKKDLLVTKLSGNEKAIKDVLTSKSIVECDSGGLLKINNSPSEFFNKKEDFKKITNVYLFMRGCILNKDAVTIFIDQYKEEGTGLCSLTDSLLGILSSSN